MGSVLQFFATTFVLDYHTLNHVDMLDKADNMLGKWQMLIYLGQQTIMHLENTKAEG